MKDLFLILAFTIICSTINAQQPTAHTMRSIISIAKERSLYLKSKRYDIDIVGKDVLTARLRPNPILNNQNLYILNKNNAYYTSLTPTTSSNNIFDSKNSQLWFQITKPMQIGKLLQNKIAFSLEAYEIAKLNYGKNESDYLYEIANQFIHASFLYKNILILTEIKNINDSIVIINENKLKNQMISSIDVTRIRLASDMYLLKMKLAELDYRNDIIKLKYELGINDSILLEEINFTNNNLPANIDSIIIQGYSNRYDIKLAQCSTTYYSKNVLLQKSIAYPYVEVGIIANPQNSVPYIGSYTTVGIPVFDRNQGAIQKSQILYQQSQVYLESVKSNASFSIVNSYSSYISSKEIAEKYSATLLKAQIVFRSVKNNYLRGNTNVLDFLEAEKSYLNLSIRCNDALNNYQLAYVNLLYNLGLMNKL